MENNEKIIETDSKPGVINDAVKEEVKELSEELQMKSQELLSLVSDPRVMRSYRSVRNDLFGIGERRQVSKAEKKKKKAKRRMAKQSKR
jgi:hypothetical protein